MNIHEIESLILLLDDPDDHVFIPIREKLSQLGVEIIPRLEKAWESTLDHLVQKRIENIIQEIHYKRAYKELQAWVKTENHDLIEAAMIIAKFQYPDFDFKSINTKIDSLRNDVWLEINDSMTALEKVKVMNHVFFDIHTYSRNVNFQKSSVGYYLNHAIETKKGAPIMLAIMYAGIAQRLGMPIYGVALPRNFILAYKDTHHDAFSETLEYGLLFYVNPFNKGIVFGKDEIDKFIVHQKLEKKASYFQTCSNLKTIKLLFKELISFFKQNAQNDKVDLYTALSKILYF